ncbi:hypothetical protein C8R48DRAFT_775158 [Suillus tomentosus]|nr:hypothetical protein C8R48DRAFT_775158 [Suillus tomentosus]
MEVNNLLARWPTYIINFAPKHPGPLKLILRLKDTSNFCSTEDDNSADEAEGMGKVKSTLPVSEKDSDITMVCEATSKPEDVTNQHLSLYNGVINYVPGLESKLNHISSKNLNMIIAMVLKDMSDSRSADLSSIKHKGLQYIRLNMYSKANVLDTPVPEIEDKLMHRLNHLRLAHLLCPQKKLDWIDKDLDSTMTALQAGKITMTAQI